MIVDFLASMVCRFYNILGGGAGNLGMGGVGFRGSGFSCCYK